MLIDSHCHLDDDQFNADREAAIERARSAGVELMMAIGGAGAVALAERYPFFYAAVGVHPHEAATVEIPRELFDHPKVLAVGEIGLDYHYDNSPRDVQRRVFAEQLSLARELRKPIAIHTREAWPDTFDILREHGLPYGGIMHCFSGGPAEAEECLAMGFHLSFAGVLTFPKAVELREAAALTPLHRLLVETDAPYLAPVPFRGKRNEPAFVVHTAKRLAEIKSVTPEALSAATLSNFTSLMRLQHPTGNGYTG